jgi:hypothetical protein
MLSPLPRYSVWLPVSLTSPDVPAFPAWVDGSACTTSFSRIAQRSLTLRPAHSPSHLVTLYTRGFSHFVTSMTAPIASGWSESCRVGLSPTEKRRLCTAHTQSDIPRIPWNGKIVLVQVLRVHSLSFLMTDLSPSANRPVVMLTGIQ